MDSGWWSLIVTNAPLWWETLIVGEAVRVYRQGVFKKKERWAPNPNLSQSTDPLQSRGSTCNWPISWILKGFSPSACPKKDSVLCARPSKQTNKQINPKHQKSIWATFYQLPWYCLMAWYQSSVIRQKPDQRLPK